MIENTRRVLDLKSVRLLYTVSFCCAMATASLLAVASAEFVGVEFKAGHPLVGESLRDALKPPSDYEERALEEDAQVLKEMPGARVEIIGFTDNQECLRQECQELSLRRARAVYDWFVAHGVSAQSLATPEGRGSEMAIDDNGAEYGRQRNRRTEVNMIRPRGHDDQEVDRQHQ